MPFDAQIIHFPTIAAFVDYLAGVPRPSWCTSICNHNTYRPDETQWRGMASMRSLLAFYSNKTPPWTSGPHLFLAAQAPNPSDTGIFQLTPINHPGTHAGACNAHTLGLESVGDFDARPPTQDQYTLLLAVNRAILERWGIPPASVLVHNECTSGRTCPGKYLTGTQIRADLSKPWSSPRARRVIGLPVYQAANHQGALWGHLRSDQTVEIDDPSNGHVSNVDGQPAAIGFVDMRGLE